MWLHNKDPSEGKSVFRKSWDFKESHQLKSLITECLSPHPLNHLQLNEDKLWRENWVLTLSQRQKNEDRWQGFFFFFLILEDVVASHWAVQQFTEQFAFWLFVKLICKAVADTFTSTFTTRLFFFCNHERASFITASLFEGAFFTFTAVNLPCVCVHSRMMVFF